MRESNDQTIKKFRDILRRFEREIFILNNNSCCSVTMAQCHTLLEIENKETDTVTELSRSLGLDKSTISRTIDGLVKNGLVDRVIPEENRRLAKIKLTEEGKNTCCSINEKNDYYFKDILSPLSESERTELIRLLEKITSHMIQLRTKS